MRTSSIAYKLAIETSNLENEALTATNNEHNALFGLFINSSPNRPTSA